jgi:FkbM family methyltransferase
MDGSARDQIGLTLKEKADPRLDFAGAMRNAMRRVWVHQAAGASAPGIVASANNPAALSPRSLFARTARVILRPAIGPARTVRAFIVAQLERRTHENWLQITDLQAKLGALQSAMAAVGAKLEALAARTHDEVQTRLTTMQDAMAAVDAKLERLAARTDDGAQIRLATLQATMAAADARLEALAARTHEEVQNRLATMQAATAAADARLEALAARTLDEVQTRLASMQVGLAASGANLDEVASRIRLPLSVNSDTVAFKLEEGFVLTPRSDTRLLLCLYEAGPRGLEPGTRRVLQRLLGPGMTFVDVGANIGLLTLVGARAVGRTGKVFTFEPNPIACELLNRTIVLNGLEKEVAITQVACGARHERRPLHIGPVLGHSSLFPIPDCEKVVEVIVAPLDDSLGTRTVDVIKIDVEGAELEVLAGMERIIRENKDLAMIAEFGRSHLHRTGIMPGVWLAKFQNFGFTVLTIDEHTGQTHKLEATKLQDKESINLLFFRSGSRAEARLA